MRFARAVPVLLVAFAVSGCHRSRPNLLLVTFDTTRWDHVGYASGRRDLTPMLDAMAARGTWFSTCLTTQPLTLPAHTSIMTGLFPYHHGVRNNGTYVVPKEDVTLATRLRAAGYATHAVVSAFVLDHQFGLDQGFDGYDDDLSGGPKQNMFMFKEIKAAQTARKAVKWLRDERPKDKPFFLWLHFFDPHADYEPPDDVAIDFPGDPYSGEIHYADRELGRVIKELDEAKLLDDTLFVFTADHGDSLGEHGEKTHGLFIYESTTRVPLFLAGPGVPAGRRVDALARTVDIVPTVLELLRLDPARGLDGVTLERLWRGRDTRRMAYMETITPRENFGWAELRALRDAGTKAIAAPRPEAFDLAADPGEQRNLFAGHVPPPAARPLLAELQAIAKSDSYETGRAQARAMEPETRKKLAALGYLWTSPPVRGNGPRADPKDRLQFWARFQGAQDLMRHKQYAAAVAEIEGLLLDDSENLHALGSLANALVHVGEKDRALEVYRRMMILDPQYEAGYRGAAYLQQQRGRFAEAQALLQVVLKLRPQDPEGPVAMGDLQIEQGRFAEAEAWFHKALALDPHSATALAGLGNCLNRAGRLKEAVEVLRTARQHDPTSHVLTYNLAVVSERLGDPRSALALYKAAIRIEPEDSMSWNNLGSLLERAGRHEEAVRCFVQAHEVDPENAEAAYNLGAMLLNGGRPAQALPLLEDALRLRPDLAPAAAFRARALVRLGRTEEALAGLRQFASHAPTAWLQVARLELGRGHTEAARAALRRGLAAGGAAVRDAVARDPRLHPLLGG
ncbi:MAG TPA: sulfatase-like hydrolase/transferase [Thermoanaerobaculia bacterium]|nr:sulfatase-like hydrolase/transferase [Thermoanaerobaculia bacterium]